MDFDAFEPISTGAKQKGSCKTEKLKLKPEELAMIDDEGAESDKENSVNISGMSHLNISKDRISMDSKEKQGIIDFYKSSGNELQLSKNASKSHEEAKRLSQ